MRARVSKKLRCWRQADSRIRDEVGVALGARSSAKTTSDLAVDDAVAQGLFRGIVGGRDIGTLQEDQ